MKGQEEELIEYLRTHGGRVGRSKLRKYPDDLLRELETEGKIKLDRDKRGTSVILVEGVTAEAGSPVGSPLSTVSSKP